MSIFVSRPLTLTILLIAALMLVGPYIPALIARLRGKRPPRARVVVGEGKED